MLGCSQPVDQGPRELEPDELARLSADGRVSPHLPSRFSATVGNNNDEVVVTHLRFRVHGNEVERIARIEPGRSRRVSLQFLFPEDPDFGAIDPDAVEWDLVGAKGIVAPH